MQAGALSTQYDEPVDRLALVAQVVLLLVIVAGVLARVLAVPPYVPDSGDEWGNTMAPLRMLYERGDPNVFLHPSLYYDVTAVVYALVFASGKLIGAVDGALSMTDLFILDDRWFVLAARAVSVFSAVAAMWVLYRLGTSLWNRLAGLTAAALLAVLPVHAVYSEAARVDSFFLAVFLYAFARIVRILDQPTASTHAVAGLCTGLAIGANYNGAILVPWLIAAHVLCAEPARRAIGHLWRALGLMALAFIASSPFILLNFSTFVANFAFISGLSLSEHPGMEGRGVLFYATDLAQRDPFLATAIALACLAVTVFGTRTERFVLSLPVAYWLLFSLMRTKFDRFVLPALALFLLVASGVPFILARRAGQQRFVSVGAGALASALLAACIATMAPRSLPVPRHQMLPRATPALFDWIDRAVPPQSRMLVESGVVPLIDTLKEPGPLAAALRRSLAAMRPNLDQQYIGAAYVGGRPNYQAAMLSRGEIDYAIVSPRNLQYIDGRCGALPEVCAFYTELRSRGRIVFEAPEGFEPVLVYDVRSR